MKKVLALLSVLSIELVIILILFAASVFGFVFLTNYIFDIQSPGFDAAVFDGILPYVNSANTRIMVLISFFASQNFLLPANIVIALYFLFIAKHRWYSIKIPVVALGSFAVMSGLKMFFQRPRPMDPVYEAARGFSFPSGHSMSAMTFYGLLIYVVWQNIESSLWRWVLTILLSAAILLIGFSRIYLRVHYASDVLAGFSVGIIWLVISLFVMTKIENYTRKEVDPSINPNE